MTASGDASRCVVRSAGVVCVSVCVCAASATDAYAHSWITFFIFFCYGDIMRKAVQGPVQAAWRCMRKVQIEAELDACYLQLS